MKDFSWRCVPCRQFQFSAKLRRSSAAHGLQLAFVPDLLLGSGADPPIVGIVAREEDLATHRELGLLRRVEPTVPDPAVGFHGARLLLRARDGASEGTSIAQGVHGAEPVRQSRHARLFQVRPVLARELRTLDARPRLRLDAPDLGPDAAGRNLVLHVPHTVLYARRLSLRDPSSPLTARLLARGELLPAVGRRADHARLGVPAPARGRQARLARAVGQWPDAVRARPVPEDGARRRGARTDGRPRVSAGPHPQLRRLLDRHARVLWSDLLRLRWLFVVRARHRALPRLRARR